MTSRLVDAGGNFLVDAAGDFLVWETEFATGSMSLAASAPAMKLYADSALSDAEAFEVLDEAGVAITDEAGDALRVVSLNPAPSVTFTLSAPTITITTSED